MAEPFQTSKQNIAKHLKADLCASMELTWIQLSTQWLTTAADGNYRVAHYNLDAILNTLKKRPKR